MAVSSTIFCAGCFGSLPKGSLKYLPEPYSWRMPLPHIGPALGLAPSALPSPVSAQALVHQKPVLCKDFLLGMMTHMCSPVLERLRQENVQSEENLENTQPNKNPNHFFPPQFFQLSEEASELTMEMSGETWFPRTKVSSHTQGLERATPS